MTTRKSTHESLSPYERAKLNRRIATYIKQGMNVTQLGRRGITPTQARAVAAEFGLEIKQGVGGRKI